MKVTGYWPLDGSAGICFLERLSRCAPPVLEKSIHRALSAYIEIDGKAATGEDRMEIEPEDFRILAESAGSEAKAKIAYGIRQQDGRYWMRNPAFDEAVRAFVSASIVHRAHGGSIGGEIYNNREAAIAACAGKLADARESLRGIALAAIGALVRLDDLAAGMPAADQALMAHELKAFAARLSGRD